MGALHISGVTTLHMANPVPMAGKENKEVLSIDFKETFLWQVSNGAKEGEIFHKNTANKSKYKTLLWWLVDKTDRYFEEN